MLQICIYKRPQHTEPNVQFSSERVPDGMKLITPISFSKNEGLA